MTGSVTHTHIYHLGVLLRVDCFSLTKIETKCHKKVLGLIGRNEGVFDAGVMLRCWLLECVLIFSMHIMGAFWLSSSDMQDSAGYRSIVR